MFGFGTIRQQVHMKALNVKWELSKGQIKIHKEEKKPLSEREMMIERFREECENNKKSETYNKIYSKIKAGKKLSPEEKEYLQANNPDMLKEYQKIQAEKSSYEKKLKNCKTKEEVERVKITKVGEYMSALKNIEGNPNIPKGKKLQLLKELNAKVTMMGKVHSEFKASAEYSTLPEESEIRKEEIKEEMERQEQVTEDMAAEVLENQEELVERAEQIESSPQTDVESQVGHESEIETSLQPKSEMAEQTGVSQSLDTVKATDVQKLGNGAKDTDRIETDESDISDDRQKLKRARRKKPTSFSDVGQEVLRLAKVEFPKGVDIDVYTDEGFETFA